jgi:hypothetical protein
MVKNLLVVVEEAEEGHPSLEGEGEVVVEAWSRVSSEKYLKQGVNG